MLIRNCPEATTKLFIDYHLGRYTPTTDIRPEIGVTETTAVKASIFQSMASLIPIPYLTVSHSATPGQDVPEPRPESPEEEPILAEYRPPKPREAFAPFSDHPHQFLEFLETIAPSIIEESDRADVYSAMLELYLSLSNSVSSSEDKEAYRAKASALIEDPTIPISPSSTLLISSVAGFQPGIVQVCSQQGGYSDIFRSYASAGDNATALQTMKQYGPSDPELYSLGLLHFTSSAEALASLGPGEFELILGLVTEKGLMSPLQVVQALSATPVAYLGLIKNYLATIITREQREILQNRSLTATHQAEAAKKAEDLANLRAHPVAFQAQRCSACGGTLELPVIHFLCKHSFHQRCLDLSRVNGGEDLEASDIECPVCKPANDTVRQILESQAQMTDHGLEIFKADMEKPRNGLRTVAEWFGRGVMDVPVLD